MAGLVYACVVPHPPIMVPEVGKGQERKVAATLGAMDEVTQELTRHHPEIVLLVSPHGETYRSAMAVVSGPSWGDLDVWGAYGLRYRFQGDSALASRIKTETEADGIPIRLIGEGGYELDHGVTVPMYFLSRGIVDTPLVPLSFSWLPLKTHYAFGQAIGRAIADYGKRVAFVASGDLSHRLIPEAPAGYNPLGRVFDEKMMAAIAALDREAVFNLDEELIEAAGECGLRSITILFGLLEGLSAKPRVLSYEGPFGVGYPVVSMEIASVSQSQSHPLVKLARETVESYVRNGTVLPVPEIIPELKARAGVFVSIKKVGELRGCIGTVMPTKDNLAEEVIANAINSATSDPRFPPIHPVELSDLTYSVDVLSEMEPINGLDQLAPRRYGVLVRSGNRRGLLLPDLEGIDTPEIQVEIAKMKAGIFHDEPVELFRFYVQRYSEE